MRNVINALRTLIYLQDSKGIFVTAAELSSELETDPRTIRRYMRMLTTDPFFPIQSKPGKNGGYCFSPKASDVALFPYYCSRSNAIRYLLSLYGLGPIDPRFNDISLSRYSCYIDADVPLSKRDYDKAVRIIEVASENKSMGIVLDDKKHLRIKPICLKLINESWVIMATKEGEIKQVTLPLADISLESPEDSGKSS